MKYNIAIIGTFDLENFGDLMFPIIFRKQMEKRVEIDNLFLFSPNACDMPLNPEKTTVYSIDKLEAIHNEYSLDAIVFGGGDLARLDNAFAPEENYIPENTSFDMMIYSAIIANKYNIPYLWNCPGVPFEFDVDDKKLVKCLLDEFTDYISVRETRSAEILKSCGCESEITVSPDTVLSISKLIDKNHNGVFDRLGSEYPFLKKPYIVFQSMVNDIAGFKENINKNLSEISEKTGKKIVFLPIGNVHKDDEYVNSILNEFSNDSFVTFDRKLNIYEIGTVLGNADEFIGTSLHGNVVSNSYGVPSIGLNLLDLVKLKNYFRFVSREEYCIKNIESLAEVYFDMVSKNTTDQIENCINKIEKHFDVISTKLGKKPEKSGDIKKILDLCYESDKNRKTNNVTVFYDFGAGYSAENSAVYDLPVSYGKVDLTIDIPENIKQIRIDPADNIFCIVKDLEIISNDQKLNYTGNYLYSEDCVNTLFFFNKDPQIFVDVESTIKEIKLRYNLFNVGVHNEVLADVQETEGEIWMLGENITSQKAIIDNQNATILQKDSVIAQKDSTIVQKDSMIEQKDSIIKKFDEIIIEKDVVIKNRDELITQKDSHIKSLNEEIDKKENSIKTLDDEIAKKEEQINELNRVVAEKDQAITARDGTIASIANQNAELSFRYNEIINSFYWRLTALPRKITGKIKTKLSAHQKTMDMLVFLKGFLRGGIKEGKKRVFNYKVFTGRIKVNPLEISKEQRDIEQKTKFKNKVKFSILVPLYNTPQNFLKEMIDSVVEQTYGNWELCLADGSDDKHTYVGKYCKNLAKKEPRIVYKKLKENKGIAENTNECLEMATGDYIALFDHDDLLHPTTLFEYAKAINNEKADYVYCDEATFTDEPGEGFNIVLANYKPDFSPDTLRSYNYICHFTCFSRKLYEMVGGFNSEFDGSQDYDLILRLTEKAKKIVHIPLLLYYWRSHKSSVASDVSAKPYVVESAHKALAAHLERQGLKGTIKNATVPTTYKIDYEIIGNPLVSIIIPTKDHIDDLDMCLRSIYSKSTYENFEIIVVENNSTEVETFEYYKKIQKKHDNIKVVFWKEKVFNYSAINNFGAKYASGDYILLLNNDIEVITPDWIQEMLMFAQRKDVGAVGAKLYYPDDTIQHAGVIIGLGGVAGHSHKYFDRQNPGYMARTVIAQNLSACTAACLLIRRDVFDEVDGIDEKFAVAFNDVDLCMKIRDAGYLIVFTPYAEFYHYESKSRGFEDSPEKVERFNGEINRFKKKWGKQLEKGDPYYNPHLTLDREDFSFK